MPPELLEPILAYNTAAPLEPVPPGCDSSGIWFPHTRRSSALLNADRMSSFRSDAASHDSDHPEDDRDEEDEDREEGTGEYRSYTTGSDPGFSKDDMRFCQRTHKPWKESDEQRLLSYKDKMAIDWD